MQKKSFPNFIDQESPGFCGKCTKVMAKQALNMKPTAIQTQSDISLKKQKTDNDIDIYQYYDPDEECHPCLGFVENPGLGFVENTSQAISTAKDERIVAIDIETTGFTPTSQIIQIGMIDNRGK